MRPRMAMALLLSLAITIIHVSGFIIAGEKLHHINTFRIPLTDNTTSGLAVYAKSGTRVCFEVRGVENVEEAVLNTIIVSNNSILLNETLLPGHCATNRLAQPQALVIIYRVVRAPSIFEQSPGAEAWLVVEVK